MQMKRIVFVLLSCLVLAFTPMPTSASSLSVSVGVSAQDPAEALLIGAAAAFFGLDTDIALSFRSKSGGTSADALALFYLSAETARPVDVIIRERGRNNWKYVADRYQVKGHGHWPPGKAKGHYKHNRWERDDYAADVTIWFLAQYYNVSPSTIVVWTQKGLALNDVVLVLNLSARARVDPVRIVDLRLKGNSWSTIADFYRVSMADLQKPVQPAKHYTKVVVIQEGKGNSGNGKGNSNHKNKK